MTASDLSRNHSPETSRPLRDTILEALRSPESARTFGRFLLPDAPDIHMDPEASEAFYAAMQAHIQNLLATHPWPRRLFGTRTAGDSFSYRQAFRLYAAISRLTMDTGLRAHYHHIRASTDLGPSQERLEKAAARLARMQEALADSVQQLTGQIAGLDALLQKTHSVLENDPEIASLKAARPEIFDLFSGRLSALSTRLVIARQQLLQAQAAENTVIRDLDRYFRLKDVFLPAYEHQLSLLGGATPRQLYRYYHLFRKSLHTQVRS